MHSGLLARLLRKKNKNGAAKSWMEDGLKVRPRIDLFEDAMSAIFLVGLKDMLANEHLLEIVMNSSMFATRDLQVHLAHACRLKLAGYLPPLALRHIRWRRQQAGAEVSEQDAKQFEQTGFQTKSKQSMEDSIRDLHHVLKVACTHGEGIMKFRTPLELHPVPVGGKRSWSEEQQRWFRTEDTPRPGVEEKLVPELPDHMFHLFQINVLIAVCDQKQSQWSSLECLAAHGFMIARREDCYHTSCRDFVWSTENAEGGFHHTCAQLSHGFNVNYHAMGMHMATKRELQSEWRRMLPTPPGPDGP